MTAHNLPENSSPPPPILLAEDLRKNYGPRKALLGLTFNLQAGRILGFLGPNGAGKTTSIRILTTMLEPDSGHFVVDGISSKYPERIRRRIGVLPEGLGFPKNTTAIEYLTYFGQLYGRTKTEAKKYGLKLLEEVGLQQRTRSLISTYSHGMRQRIGIARALVNDPSVVFLDEPTLGLDPRGQQELLVLIQRIARERGVGVILCSHALSEIEGFCDDVVIMSSGQVVAKGSVAEVIGRARQNTIRIHVPSPLAEEAQRVLAALPNVMKVTLTGEMRDWLQVELVEATNGKAPTADEINNNLLSGLIGANISVLGFEVEGGKLQDVFLHLTEGTIK